MWTIYLYVTMQVACFVLVVLALSIILQTFCLIVYFFFFQTEQLRLDKVY